MSERIPYLYELPGYTHLRPSLPSAPFGDARDPLTSDLAEFGARERALVVELLEAWERHGLPDDFEDEEVRPMFNRESAYVFLTNANYDVALAQDGRLVSHYFLSYEGHEGTLEELAEQYEADVVNGETIWHRDDVNQLEEIAIRQGAWEIAQGLR